MKRLVFGIIVGCLVAFWAQPSGATTRFFVRGGFGWGSQSLTEFFDDNEALRDDLRDESTEPDSFRSDLDDFGGALGGGGELGIRITDLVSLSIGGDFERHTVTNTAVDVEFEATDEFELSVLDIALSVDYWTPTVPGFFAGAVLGIAMADLSRSFNLEGIAGEAIRFDGEWDDSAIMIGLRGGYQYEAPNGFVAFALAGFRFRPIGTLRGVMTLSQEFAGTTVTETATGTYESFSTLDPVDFDFSGAFGRVGIGFAFGVAPTASGE